MTAIQMYVGSDGVVMLTDGIAYDEAGIVRQIHSKQWVIPSCDCVLASSGTGGALHYIKMFMEWDSPQDFDQLIDLLPAATEKAHQELKMNLRWPNPQFMVLAAGWSEKAQAYKGFSIFSLDWEVAGSGPVKAYTLVPEWAFSKPGPDKDSLEREGLTDDFAADLTRLGPINFGIAMMLAQRTTNTFMHHGEEALGYIVGGFVELSVVSRGKANSQIILRWPDTIGNPIYPEAGHWWSDHLVQPETETGEKNED